MPSNCNDRMASVGGKDWSDGDSTTITMRRIRSRTGAPPTASRCSPRLGWGRLRLGQGAVLGADDGGEARPRGAARGWGRGSATLCLSRERENERGRDERAGVNELRGKMVTEG